MRTYGSGGGHFIVFEGIDGSGKTTQLHRIDEALRGMGIPTLVTCEPSDGETGKRIRRCLRGEEKADGRLIGELFAEDRLEHAKKLRAVLDGGTWVLCDRYFLSSLAYQGECMTAEDLTEINKAALDILTPSLTLYFHITPEAAAERMNKRGEAREIFEKLDYQRGVYKRYADAVRARTVTDNIETVDASADEETVAKAALDVLKAKFGGLK